jgi:hypothetical protein
MATTLKLNSTEYLFKVRKRQRILDDMVFFEYKTLVVDGECVASQSLETAWNEPFRTLQAKLQMYQPLFRPNFLLSLNNTAHRKLGCHLRRWNCAINAQQVQSC